MIWLKVVDVIRVVLEEDRSIEREIRLGVPGDLAPALHPVASVVRLATGVDLDLEVFETTVLRSERCPATEVDIEGSRPGHDRLRGRLRERREWTCASARTGWITDNQVILRLTFGRKRNLFFLLPGPGAIGEECIWQLIPEHAIEDFQAGRVRIDVVDAVVGPGVLPGIDTGDRDGCASAEASGRELIRAR